MNKTDRQKLGVKSWLNAGCNGILLYCTGMGKTRTAIMIIYLLVKQDSNYKILISVPNINLKGQWIKELTKFNVINNCTVEVINTICKYTWDDIKLLIVDEIHTSVSNTFYNIYKNVKYEMLLGLTGTINRLDKKESKLFEISKIVDSISVDEAIDNGWLSHYTDYKVYIDVDLEEYNKLNQKFNAYFSYFNYDFNLAMKCVKDWKYRNSYGKHLGIDSKSMTAMAMDWNRCLRDRKSFVMSHPKKLEIAHKILSKRPGSKAITFSAFIKDAEKVNTGQVLHSKQTKKKNKITLEEFDKLDCGVLNTAKSLDLGADISGLDLAIIISGTSSEIQKKQRLGRILRFQEGKKAELFTLVLRGTVEDSWYSNSTKSNYITINESQLDIILNGDELELRSRESTSNVEYRF